MGDKLLRDVCQPTLVIHSQEDHSVPFSHARWSLEHIPNAEVVESGLSGHFFWIGPDFPRASQNMVAFFQVDLKQPEPYAALNAASL